jgi:hypothetical protein
LSRIRFIVNDFRRLLLLSPRRESFLQLLCKNSPNVAGGFCWRSAGTALRQRKETVASRAPIFGKDERPANSSPAIGTAGFRRRGRDAFVANLFLTGGLLFDASFLPVHAPRKILIPHNTTAMADTSVATANTLSKEATLILLSASQPR